jgi:hypothetical protein
MTSGVKVILSKEAQDKLSKTKGVNFSKMIENINSNKSKKGIYAKFGLTFEKIGKLIILL